MGLRLGWDWRSFLVYGRAVLALGLVGILVAVVAGASDLGVTLLVGVPTCAAAIGTLGAVLDRRRGSLWHAPLRGFGIASLAPLIVVVVLYVPLGVVSLVTEGPPSLHDLVMWPLFGIPFGSGVLLTLTGPLTLPAAIWAAFEREAGRARAERAAAPVADPSGRASRSVGMP